MNDEIHIPILPGLGEDNEEEVFEYLAGLTETLRPAFDLKVDDGDERTTCVNHQITCVTLTDYGVQIDYEISTHTFYGCKDIDSEGFVCRTVNGVSNGTHWVFRRSLSVDPRSTFEEF
jgi:hypothetical protein